MDVSAVQNHNKCCARNCYAVKSFQVALHLFMLAYELFIQALDVFYICVSVDSRYAYMFTLTFLSCFLTLSCSISATL